MDSTEEYSSCTPHVMYGWSGREKKCACAGRIWHNLEDSRVVQALAHAVDDVQLEYSRVFKDAGVTNSTSFEKPGGV